MKKSILGVLVLSIIGLSTNLSASEVGARYVDYENASGMQYDLSLDIIKNFTLEGSYSVLNADEFSLLNASRGEDQEPDIKMVSYGLGYTYPISLELEVYASAQMTSLKTDGLTFTLQDPSGGDPIDVELDIEEIDGKEFKFGVAYKFLDYFEVDVAAKQIQYDDDIAEDVTAGEVGLSLYINPKLKITASYSSDSFLQEPKYSIGATFRF